MATPELTQRKVTFLAGNYGLDTADVINALDGVDTEDPEAIFDAITAIQSDNGNEEWDRPRYSPASVEAFADAFVALDEVPHVGASDDS